MISVYDDQSVLFCSWSVVLSAVSLTIRMLKGRGGRLSRITDAKLRGGLAVNGDIIFRHPVTVTLQLNQQSTEEGLRSPLSGLTVTAPRR